MFALCLAITQTWYASGHDEWLAGRHLRHHRGVATGYFIYHQHYTDNKEEQVRYLIVQPPMVTAKNLPRSIIYEYATFCRIKV